MHCNKLLTVTSKLFLLTIILFTGTNRIYAQLSAENPVHFVSPSSDVSKTNSSSIYLRGLTYAGSNLQINNENVKVYSTGAFYHQLSLSVGKNEITVLHTLGNNTTSKTLQIEYELPEKPKPVEGFAIEYVKLIPDGDMWLQPGDAILIEMKASPGMKASFYKNIPMWEMKDATVEGIYRGEYILKEGDTLNNEVITVQLWNTATGDTITAATQGKIRLLPTSSTITGVTRGAAPSLAYGLGGDRLGGAKMGSIDTLVRMEVTGKIQGLYRVRLAEQVQAYISERNLQLDEGSTSRPYSLTGSWSVLHTNNSDQVTIGLSQRLPYASWQQLNPTTLVVDIYGAVNNTNWITQRTGLKAIKNIWHEQVAKDIFRVYIELQKPQLWGYDIGYRGNSLVIKVRPQPENLKLRELTIGVDAGHGGTADGARGLTGVLEKNITLAIARKLKNQLEKEGVKVIMTRGADTTTPNAGRTRLMKEAMPDFLVSIHCNSASRPTAKGASTYYKHIAYRNVTTAVYDEVLKLGLDDFGNIGSFNFFFNAPTEYQTVLVETAFISSPDDEVKLINEEFQQKMAEQIIKGLKNFLKQVKKENKAVGK